MTKLKYELQYAMFLVSVDLEKQVKNIRISWVILNYFQDFLEI
jgi:hypothetical protein